MAANAVMPIAERARSPLAAIAGGMLLLQLAGCAGLWTKAPQTEAESESSQLPTPVQGQAKAPSEDNAGGKSAGQSAAVEQGEPGTENTSSGSVAKLESAPAKPSAAAAVSRPPAAGAGQGEKSVPPTLDLDTLVERLKGTSAIGFFTKIALKDQVDELLDKFRAFYQGHSSFSLAQLRQPFDLLIMKVLALLQDKDPKLAGDILASREALWDILSDPVKFAKI